MISLTAPPYAAPAQLEIQYSCVFSLLNDKAMSVHSSSDIPKSVFFNTLTDENSVILHINLAIFADNAIASSKRNDCSIVATSSIFTLTVNFTPNEIGDLYATLTISSNAPDSPSFNVPLSRRAELTPQPIISASHDAMGLGAVQINDTVSFSPTTPTANIATLTMTSNHIDTQTLSITLDGIGSRTPLPIITASGAEFGNVDATLIIFSNEPRNTSLTIPLIAAGITLPQPELTISTDTLSFGDVELGNAKRLTLIAKNTGSTTLSLTTSVTGADRDSYFSLKSNRCRSLPPTETCTIHISFAPSSSGIASSELKINSATSPIQVSLNGNGTGFESGLPSPRNAHATAHSLGEEQGGIDSFNTFLFLMISLLALRLSTRRSPLGPRYRRH